MDIECIAGARRQLRLAAAACLVACLPTLAVAASRVASTSIPDLDARQWRADLDVFASELVRCHRNAFHSTSPERFHAAVHALDRRIPTLQDHEVMVGLHELAAMVGDGHTFLGTEGRYRAFPLEVFWFGDALRVTRAGPHQARAVGARLVAIAGTDVAEVHRRLQRLIPQSENAWYVLEQGARLIVQAEVLAALGVLTAPDTAVFTFQDEAGERFDLPLVAGAADSARMRAAPDRVPLHRQRPSEGFWFTWLPGTGTVYANFRSYADLDGHAAALLASVEKHAARRLILDLRQNRGGNYTLARQHLLYKLQMLPAINRPGGLYVVTGRATFSAAMTTATDFRRETEAILVGEPPGARPNGYQELSGFTLPNSGLRVHCAILRYRFQPGEATAVLPDQWLEPDWDAYRTGRDAAVDWILAQPLETAPAR